MSSANSETIFYSTAKWDRRSRQSAPPKWCISRLISVRRGLPDILGSWTRTSLPAFGSQCFEMHGIKTQFALSRFLPKHNRADDEHHPWQQRPDDPKLNAFIHRERDRPR